MAARKSIYRTVELVKDFTKAAEIRKFRSHIY